MVGTTAGNSSAGGGHFTGPIVQGASGLYQQQLSLHSGNSIQSSVLGVGYYPLNLNALGGQVIVGAGGISSAGNLVMASGKGIDFSAATPDGTGTTGSEVLDDYEEGTWTPGISFGGGVVGLTYTIQVGYYTKVGNLVTATCRIFLSAKGTSTGSSAVTGLPFTSSSTTNSYSMPSLRLASITFADAFQGYNGPNGTLVTLKEVTNAGADTPLTDANFTDTSTVMMTLTYRV
jgi:hypothetical protein